MAGRTVSAQAGYRLDGLFDRDRLDGAVGLENLCAGVLHGAQISASDGPKITTAERRTQRRCGRTRIVSGEKRRIAHQPLDLAKRRAGYGPPFA